MKKKLLAIALAVTAVGAQAALQTLAAPYWAPPGSTGLETVEFNVSSNAFGLVALGAHAYKNGPLLPNDGASTFYAQGGTYAPDGNNYANWSFDFSYAIDASCQGCKAFLFIDKDPTAGIDMVGGAAAISDQAGPAYMESWNMEMGFLTANVYDFNPFAASSTAFRLEIRDAAGATVLSSDITVEVPEPGTLALAGLALAGLGLLRRRH